jgi:hypothetical protein
MEVKKFIMPGVGKVEAIWELPIFPPYITFEDGTVCKGLPRTACEVAPLGYREDEIGEANFIHEALHLFVAGRLKLGDRGVQRRTADGCKFDCEESRRDADREEQIVLGLQAIYNDSLSKVTGFHYHLIAAAIRNADIRLRAEPGIKTANVQASVFGKMFNEQNIS